ncbi:gamma-glutamylcyclotransferase-like [Anticarsia gemmatalis]|uniref:gamma-glutamylcyclotransferase-like n=1 Tax=Anticarsia gemmatalis TaxID=129554 RepID=UPI003F75BB2F
MVKSKDHFCYFAYGSNLLKKRIHINNASAVFVGTGQLENHQLDFVKYSANWQGAVATIVPKENENVWGAIWKVHNDDLAALDRQEGVATKAYFAKMVDIKKPDGTTSHCRTYQHTFTPPSLGPDEKLPEDRRPSITYIDCIVKGAIECHLPGEYIEMLKTIPNNGQHASPEIREKLDI